MYGVCILYIHQTEGLTMNALATYRFLRLLGIPGIAATTPKTDRPVRSCARDRPAP